MGRATEYTYQFVRVYTDETGNSRLGTDKITLKGESFMGGPPVLSHILTLAAGQSPQIAHIPAGSSYDYHPSVARQYVFVIQGTVDFIASDGSGCQATPGTLILFEDTTGQGHKTRCTGRDDHIALMIPLPPK